MLTIQVHDEQVAQQLQEIAARENRPVEDVLKTMLAQYPAKYPATSHNETEPSNPATSAKRIRQKAYVKARAYWHEIGDSVKANLSDAELDEHFAAFDDDGIPRLKSELDLSSPPVGSLAYAAKVMREMGAIDTNDPVDVLRTDAILREEYAEYLLKRERGEDAPK